MMREWIYGRNPVWEVLAAGRRHVFQLQIAQGVRENRTIERIRNACEGKNIPISYPPRFELDALYGSHQGVALEVGGYPYTAVEDFLLSPSQNLQPFYLILDMLQDPQNLGTLLRTAEAVGVQGVVIPLKRAAKITPAVVNASSGACEHLPIAQSNLVQALRLMKESGVFIYGLAQGEGAIPVRQARLDGPVGLVVGNEGQGMRRLVKETCDVLIELPMVGQVESLNAAIAGSVALYFILNARRQVDK